MGHDQNVGKQDRSVKTETANGLQCNLCGRIAIIGKFQKPTFLCAQFTIFGQITPSLTHQPYWRRIEFLTAQRREQFALWSFGRHGESNNIYIYIRMMTDDGLWVSRAFRGECLFCQHIDSCRCWQWHDSIPFIPVIHRLWNDGFACGLSVPESKDETGTIWVEKLPTVSSLDLSPATPQDCPART